MPLFTYQCTCGLRFEKRVSFSERGKEQTCDCGQKAPQVLTSEVGFTVHQETQGTLPQNTGFSQIDASYDRVIAQDSEKKWEGISKRDEQKQKLLAKNPGVTKEDLGRNLDGSYRVLPTRERQINERARIINAIGMTKKAGDVKADS